MALKVASTKGNIDDAKQTLIHNYFVKDWGYDPEFTREGLKYTASKLNEFSIDEQAQALAEFASKNRDCNFKTMSEEILGFLRNIVNAEGKIEGQEAKAIEKIEATFKQVNRISVSNKVRSGWGAIKKTFGKVRGKVGV